MSIPIFIYSTLKRHRIQEEALGQTKMGRKAFLPGYEEYYETLDGERYPSIGRGDHLDTGVHGEIILVNGKELTKLDQWEEKYERIPVVTDKGDAWAYVLKSEK